MGVCGGNTLCCVLFLFGVFDNMPPNIWSYSTAPPSRSHVSSSRAHRLSRLTAPRAARCRGGSRRRGRSGRVWDLACIRFGCKKPHPSSIRCRGLRSSASDRSFAFGSARPSFLLSPPLNMYWVGWGGAQAFPRERITPSVLSNCCSPIPPGISSRGSHLRRVSPPGFRAGFGVIL